MTAALPISLLLPIDCAVTSHKVWEVVEATKRVNDVYQNTQVILRQYIFQQQFLNSVTQQIVEVQAEAEASFLNSTPFTTETYREAREAHELLGKSLEMLQTLSAIDINLEKLPQDYHPLVKAVRQLFQTLTQCHAHLSTRFDEMDAMQPNVTQSKYLRRVTGAERWNSRPSVYEYQV
jgi:urease gamma subunit